MLLVLAAALALIAGGCGGDSEPSEAERGDAPQALRDEPDASVGPEIVVATLGDSIIAGTPGYEPDPALRAGGYGTNERSQFQYWAALADARLRFRNCGVAGETTEEIAKRLNGCAEGADVLVVQGGINDIAQSLSGELVDRITATDEAGENLEAMVEEGKELGLEVEIADVLPWNNGHPYATPLIQRLNVDIQRIAAEQDVTLLPFHDVLEDPEFPDLMKPEWTADGDHPSVAGYRRLGELAWRLP